MDFATLKSFIRSDLYRYVGQSGWKTGIQVFFSNPGFKYSAMMRLCLFFKTHSFSRYTVFFPSAWLFHRYSVKYGICIPFTTKIGSGFYIGHYGGIVVSKETSIGKNCNISHGVTIGQANRGIRKGQPAIGDNVYIGPGAKIFGSIKIGNGCAIGANSVVNKDVPDNSVVVGVPGVIISSNGSQGYINRTDY